MRYSEEITDRCKFLNTGEVRTPLNSQTKLYTDRSRLYLVHSSTVLISIYFMVKSEHRKPKLIFSTYKRRRFSQLNLPVDSLITAPFTVEK
jgi:hypothetical protein